MSYGRADYLYGLAEDAGLPGEQAGLHIGFFVAWAIHRDLLSADHLKEHPHAVHAVRSRELTGKSFLTEYCDEKLWESDLNRIGNDFAKQYYGQTYFDDFEIVFGVDWEHSFQAGDTWENFDRMAQKLDERFTRWKAEGEIPRTTFSIEAAEQVRELPGVIRRMFIESGPMSKLTTILLFGVFVLVIWLVAPSRWNWSPLPAAVFSLLCGFGLTMLAQSMIADRILKKYAKNSSKRES